MQALKACIRRCEGGFGDPALRRYVPTKLGGLDRRLAGGGLPAAAVTALLVAGRAAEAAWTVAVLLAAAIVRAAVPPFGGEAILVEAGGEGRGEGLYPPAVADLGLGLERTLFVRPVRARDGPWALEEALRSPAVAVAVGRVRRAGAPEVRRLELAAEAGGGIGLVLAREAEAGALARVPVVLRVAPKPARPAERGPPGPLAFGLEVVRSKGTWIEAGREVVVRVGAANPVSDVSGAEDGPARAGFARACG